jgi:hypothetical protein
VLIAQAMLELRMKDREFGRRALTFCVAAALLAACGRSQPPVGASGAMPQTTKVAPHADHDSSWMAPDSTSLPIRVSTVRSRKPLRRSLRSALRS